MNYFCIEKYIVEVVLTFKYDGVIASKDMKDDMRTTLKVESLFEKYFSEVSRLEHYRPLFIEKYIVEVVLMFR